MAGIVDKFKRMWDAPDDEYEYDDVLTVQYGLECDRIFRDMEKLPQVGAEELYYYLDEAWERNLLMDSIRAMINDETTFGVYMEEDRIYLDPEVRKRPEHPDVFDSMTSSLLWIQLNNEFGEETDFEDIWQKTFAAYPKKTNYASARSEWMGRILQVIEPNRKDVATMIWKAMKSYLKDYKEKNTDDDNYRFVPAFNKWLTEELDYWLAEIQRRKESEE